MQLFAKYDIEIVSHYAPLHYLTHIARSVALKSKPALIADGFDKSHFRSKSRCNDVRRGFGEYAFLTLDLHPRIVMAKLKGGFPHVAIEVPVDAFEYQTHHLCRYNVAMTRRLRRFGSPGWPESGGNGRYYGHKQIPIAVDDNEKNALLDKHYKKGTMIEVLVPGQLDLPPNTRISCYDRADAAVVRRILKATRCNWIVSVETPPGPYHRSRRHVSAVVEYIDKALASPDWLGNGLDFDNV